MNKAKTPPKRRARAEKELVDRLRGGLSEGEIERVLTGALSTLGSKGLSRLARKLGPDRGAALRRALRSGKKKPPAPGPGKVLQEWKRAWDEWDVRIQEASYEEGEYVVQDNDWEEPYVDPASLSRDLEPIAARMSKLLQRVFEKNLDPKLSFAKAVKESVEEIGSGVPDWMQGVEEVGFDLGPQATRCLIEWEWRSARRKGGTVLHLVDLLRDLEHETECLSLHESALANFVRGLSPEDKKDVLAGIKRNRDKDRWKSVLHSASDIWFRIYKDLCRKQDRPAYLDTCRAKIAQDWSLALPVIKDLAKKKQHAEVFSLCAQAASSFLGMEDGKQWDPRVSLFAPRGKGPDDEPDKRFKELFATWRDSARELGREETAAAVRLQCDLLYDWRNWDKALAAFRRVPSPRFDAVRERLFEQWRCLAAERSLNRVALRWMPFTPKEDPRKNQMWVHALADAAWREKDGSSAFLKKIRLWLKQAEENQESLHRFRDGLARLSVDVDSGAWLKQASPSLAGILGGKWTVDGSLLSSRRRWLSRLGAAALIPELKAFWERNAPRLVPEPGADCDTNYEDCSDWLRAVQELDPPACRKILNHWAKMHRRRRNLWRAVRSKGLPVPELRGKKA